MNDIKFIRDNAEDFNKGIINRNVKFDINELLNLDKQKRELIQKKEKLEQQKK